MEQSQKRKDIIKAAKLYYYGDMSQEEIALLMEISRPKVSRMLAQARQLNIVQITVNDPFSSGVENAEKLRRHFGLKHVGIVPTENSEGATKDAVGRAASELLNDWLRDDIKIGVAWGTTLSSFAREFNAKRSVSGAKIVQLVGGTYSQSLNIDGREMVKTLAKKLRCEHSILQAPMIVHNPKLREMLMQEPDVITHFALVDKLDIAFVGIGSSYYKDSIAYRANYIEESAGRQLSELGLVCDICGHQLLPDGTAPKTFLSDRVVGVTLEQLHRIPLVVGLGIGHKKTAPIRAALRGRHINAMIIDEVAALSIITEEHIV